MGFLFRLLQNERFLKTVTYYPQSQQCTHTHTWAHHREKKTSFLKSCCSSKTNMCVCVRPLLSITIQPPVFFLSPFISARRKVLLKASITKRYTCKQRMCEMKSEWWTTICRWWSGIRASSMNFCCVFRQLHLLVLHAAHEAIVITI